MDAFVSRRGLTPEEVSAVPLELGVYKLYRYDVVRRVGRGNLRRRLQRWLAKGKYSAFCFALCADEQEAYDRECTLWHYHGGASGDLDNEKHPEVPVDTWWCCPKCSHCYCGGKELL